MSSAARADHIAWHYNTDRTLRPECRPPADGAPAVRRTVARIALPPRRCYMIAHAHSAFSDLVAARVTGAATILSCNRAAAEHRAAFRVLARRFREAPRRPNPGGSVQRKELRNGGRGSRSSRDPRAALQPGRHALAERLDAGAARCSLRARVSWSLYALGHGLCRPAAGVDRARARVHVEALNERGAVCCRPSGADLAASTRSDPAWRRRAHRGRIADSERALSRRNSAAASRRSSRCCARLDELFASPDDEHLGLYGAFGYDLVFQFEPMSSARAPDDQRDLVLYLPDEL